MADGIKRPYAKPQSQPQRAGATLAANQNKKPYNSSSTTSTISSSSKFYSIFLFKALIVAIISLVIIPYLNLYFPSPSPSSSASDSNYSSSVTTRAWELFHLIFVGIAVSYGLFSRKNRIEDDASDLDNKDNNQCASKFDNAQSYMSKLLQVSSVFEDDNPSALSSFDSDDRSNSKKVQTWSSQYHRNKPPMLVVAENEVDNTRSVVVEKPLLLPVRSLKSRVSDDGHVNAVGSNSRGFARSYSSSVHDHNLDDDLKALSRNREDGSDSTRRAARAYGRSYSSPSANGSSSDFRGITASDTLLESQIHDDLDYAHGDNHESLGGSSLSSTSRSFPSYPMQENHDHMDDHDIKEMRTPQTVVLPSPIPWRSRSERILIKPDLDDSTISPSLQGSGRSQSSKSLSSQFSLKKAPASSTLPTQLSPTPSVPSPKKLSPSPSLSSESQAKIVEDVGRGITGYSSHLPPPPPPPPPPPSYTWRLVKNSASQDHGHSSCFEDSDWGETKSLVKGNGEKFLSKVTAEHPNKVRDDPDANLVGKSVRTFRSMGVRKASDTAKQELIEGEQNMNENPESKNDAQVSKSCFSEFAKETRDFLEEVLVDTDDTFAEVRLENESLNDTPSNNVSDEGPDVDKKADEFIAKFREQIRLQRMELIKRSAGQLNRTDMR